MNSMPRSSERRFRNFKPLICSSRVMDTSAMMTLPEGRWTEIRGEVSPAMPDLEHAQKTISTHNIHRNLMRDIIRGSIFVVNCCLLTLLLVDTHGLSIHNKPSL